MLKASFIIFAGLLSALISVNAYAQGNPLFDTLSKPQLISRQFSFTEGASVDKNGNVFFTDQPNNKIWEYSTGGKLTLFLDSAGRSNGMYFDKDGDLITCADEHEQLWSISPGKKIKVLLERLPGTFDERAE